MPRKHEYAWDNLYRALSDMATSTENMQDRLSDAAYHHIAKLLPVHFPVECRAEFTEISRALSAVKSPTGGSGLRATIASLNEDEAAELARRIASLFYEVDSAGRQADSSSG